MLTDPFTGFIQLMRGFKVLTHAKKGTSTPPPGGWPVCTGCDGLYGSGDLRQYFPCGHARCGMCGGDRAATCPECAAEDEAGT